MEFDWEGDGLEWDWDGCGLGQDEVRWQSGG